MPLKLPSFRSRKEPYPADLWTQCPDCNEMLFNKQLEKSLRVCSSCGHHFRFGARPRLFQFDNACFEQLNLIARIFIRKQPSRSRATHQIQNQKDMKDRNNISSINSSEMVVINLKKI